MAMHHPQMVWAIAMTGRRNSAAELHRDIAEPAERPVAACGVELEHGRISSGGFGGMILFCGGRRIGGFTSKCLRRLRGNRPSWRSRFALLRIVQRGRCNRLAICDTEFVGHKVISSRSSSSVQRDMVGPRHGSPQRLMPSPPIRAAACWRLHLFHSDAVLRSRATGSQHFHHGFCAERRPLP